jgi:serine/threonine-protein kinase
MASPAALPSDVDALPRRFGRYVLFDKIGEGGMARIFLARASTELGGERLLVVKEMLPMLASSDEMSRLLVEEAKLCATLTHKNIVQVYDLGRDENRLYIAMEYVEGLDLRELLRGCSQKKVPLPVEFSLFIVEETIRALDYAHRKRNDEGVPLGIVHRDISPSNVLLSVEGEVKLCDFGIARALTSSALLPEDAIQGKAGYMSPEAARGDGVDARSDVFAVGILLWELLAGQRLYRTGGDRPPVIEQAREAVIPPLPTRGYPDEARLAAIVARALAKNPDERFPSAHAMLDEVETYVREHRFGASALRFGDWLVEHFGGELVALRRERERAAMDLGAAFAAPEGLPSVPASRAELPTLPDPNAEERSALRQKIVEPFEPPHRRPSTAFIVILVVLFLIAGAIVSLFFGRR